MRSRRRVLLVHRIQRSGVKALGEPSQRRPKPTVHERHLPADQPGGDDHRRLARNVDDLEDLVASRVTPPAAVDGLADDKFGQTGLRTVRGLKDDAAPTNYRYRFDRHRPSIVWTGQVRKKFDCVLWA